MDAMLVSFIDGADTALYAAAQCSDDERVDSGQSLPEF